MIAWSIRSCPGTAQLLALPGKEPAPGLSFIFTLLQQGAVWGSFLIQSTQNVVGWEQLSKLFFRAWDGCRDQEGCFSLLAWACWAPQPESQPEISFLGCSGTPSCKYGQ